MSLSINDYKGHPLFDALIELNEQLIKEDNKPIELNVIGGFALMCHGLREADGRTDIDYIGPELSTEISNISDQIGLKYNLGRGWINNDCILSGTTLEDLEFTTGKLHFVNAFNLEKIKINILKPADLLKMKIISIDTQLCAVNTKEILEFTRYKDFADIKLLMQSQNISIEDIKNNASSYMITDSHTLEVLQTYLENGIDAVLPKIQECLKKSYEQYEKEREKYRGQIYTRSPIISQMLDNAIKRADDDTNNKKNNKKITYDSR